MVWFELFICILASLKRKWLSILMSDLFLYGPGFVETSMNTVMSCGGSCPGIRSVMKPRFDHFKAAIWDLEKPELVRQNFLA